MATWQPLRDRLAAVDSELSVGWDDLDDMVGGLPRSAYRHAAFWKGVRSGWPGFTISEVRVGDQVTFVRRGGAGSARAEGLRPERLGGSDERNAADVILVGCVMKKRGTLAPAKDLYISALFSKERAYAESTGAPWFILSAQHGLVDPGEELAPYDLRLSTTTRDYRRRWGAQVVEKLQAVHGPVEGTTIEVHAGAAYVHAISALLEAAGAHVVLPLAGLTMGERLRWYNCNAHLQQSTDGPQLPRCEADALVEALGDEEGARRPSEFLATEGAGLRTPGLYSWWVDGPGAMKLSAGLRHEISPGLIYAGLAGATRTRTGRKSTNTLWGRIKGMHLRGRVNFSTFRLSLGSIIASADGAGDIDETRLTEWMHEHLRVVAVPVSDGDALEALETAVLADLDPPLNLAKMPRTPVRARLAQLRREFKAGSL